MLQHLAVQITLGLKMNRPWLRVAGKLQFRDPRSFLVNLRRLEVEIALSDTPSRIKSLRTNGLKEAREQREAALFCVGMSQRIGQAVYFASHEDQDFDFVASWAIGNSQYLTPVQLKEVVPASLNPSATIDSVIQSLEKYADSSDLTVAIHLNQAGQFELEALKLQHLQLASVWVFAAVTADQSLWNLWGNFTEDGPYRTQFSYPAEALPLAPLSSHVIS